MGLIGTILTASVTSGIVTALVSWFIKVRERDELRRWEIKREACLDALRIIDARFSDYDWKDSNGNPIKIDKGEKISTGEIRSCFNKLVLSCEESDVPECFEKCLNLNLSEDATAPLNMNDVVPLRNAIRKELGFGEELITKLSWINYINWRN
ncbi:MAG: hypothetical protein P8179_15120 [Candidatus Thiodiazotropha sp.]